MSNDVGCRSCGNLGFVARKYFVGIAQVVQAVTPMMHELTGDSAYSDI